MPVLFPEAEIPLSLPCLLASHPRPLGPGSGHSLLASLGSDICLLTKIATHFPLLDLHDGLAFCRALFGLVLSISGDFCVPAS